MQVTIGRESVYPTHFNLRSNNIGDDSDCHWRLESSTQNIPQVLGSPRIALIIVIALLIQIVMGLDGRDYVLT
jgi:hypothetical protein